MIAVFNHHLFPEEVSERIIKFYKSKLVHYDDNLRNLYVYHERDNNSWLWKEVTPFIHRNMGINYKLIERVAVLKYEVGCHFKEHEDGSYNSSIAEYRGERLPYHFYAGVELSNKDNFKGGEFITDGKEVEFRTGRMFTHDFNTVHEVKEVTEGTRWAIHFPVEPLVNNTVI